MAWLRQYAVEFWAMTAELSPWLLLGCVLAGLLHVALPRDLIRRHLGGNRFMNVVKAVLFGVPLPLCSCGVLPAGLALKREGASDGAAVGFLISTPQTGVDSITVSAALLGWPFAFVKVVAATVTGLVGGAWANLGVPDGTLAPPGLSSPRPPAGRRSPIRWLREVLAYGFVEILGGMWLWLILGLCVSALVATILPAEALTDKPWAQGLPGMLLMLVIGVPLYVCTTGSLPIAAALIRAGLAPGAAMVFLMAGPATNAATLAALWKGLGRRPTLIYLATIAAGSMLFGWLFDAVVAASPAAAAACHAEGAGWVGHVSAALLLALCAGLAWRAWRPRRRADGTAASTDGATPERLEVAVRGMTCAGCSRRLQGVLSRLDGVTEAAVSHEKGLAHLVGHGLRRPVVEQAIREAGFEPVS